MKTYANPARIANRLWRRVRMTLYRSQFASYGRRFVFDPDGVYSFDTITVGDDSDLGLRPILLATRSRICIGSHVMFGPEVAILGGEHRTDVAGRLMKSIRDVEKRPEDDLGVVIDDDVWIGTRAIILHGVTIGRGAVVGAGCVVTRSVPPYAIVVGAPARVVRFRWDIETIMAHEKAIYPPEERFSRDQLEAWRRVGLDQTLEEGEHD